MGTDKKLKKDIFEDEIGGDAFTILRAFRKQALKEEWTLDEIGEVVEEAKKDDYDHLIQTIMKHTE